ncbi:unnamed protein product [Gulo gulo]|uniref:Uncharacterized protein n=1 Tax=Gulo gulo TaxID=48420 RepID=A0A9X9LNZ8_GULGU|nr:unnamed protein product [Gulo gulo]
METPTSQGRPLMQRWGKRWAHPPGARRPRASGVPSGWRRCEAPSPPSSAAAG